MIAYAFRFLNDDRKPSDYVGLVFAQNKKMIFKEIDQYGDANLCQIRVIEFGSFCFLQGKLIVGSNEYSEDSKFETSIELSFGDEEDWQIPDWTEFGLGEL